MTNSTDEPVNLEDEKDAEFPVPERAPTTREKIGVLFPALIAFGGMILMLVTFLLIVAFTN